MSGSLNQTTLGGAIASLMIGVAAGPASADDLTPVVVASIQDSPRDGNGDSFNGDPFQGLIRQTGSAEDRAVVEFDVSAYAGMKVTSATVSGTVWVNNSADNGLRTFDFILYTGNGTADLSDFEIPGTVVGAGSYHPPTDWFFDFEFDVTDVLQSIMNGGSMFVGLKCDPTSEPSFPNVLLEPVTLSITAEPCAVLTQVVAASIQDSPRDGNGDTFNTDPFTGLVRQTGSLEDRAIVEFDLAAFADATVASATVSGTVWVNNSADNGVRTFDFLLYEGNGVADLSDFEIPCTWVGSGSYQPPTDWFFDFEFDVTSVLQSLIDGGATYVGMKVDPISEPNSPNTLLEPVTLMISAWPCLECAADLDGSGDVGFGDLLVVLDAWGEAGGAADLDGSGTVGFGDLLMVLDAWGPC